LHTGGDVNITDGDGDTPLYTVENIETAQWLIDHGALIDRRNNDGVSVSCPVCVNEIKVDRVMKAG